jgi:nitric oxide reductase NorE protein
MNGQAATFSEATAEPQVDAGKGHLPGEPALWVFVFGDLVIFSIYLIIYMFYRSGDVEGFSRSQALLSQGLGVLNTLILITSSWFVALGVQAARRGELARARNFIALCFGCGLLFCLVKAVEWSSKIGQGLTIETDQFFSFYFMLTGTHLYHVVMGLGVLVFAWRELGASARPRMMYVEICAVVWHMVDLLWIVIYALIYLLR